MDELEKAGDSIPKAPPIDILTVTPGLLLRRIHYNNGLLLEDFKRKEPDVAKQQAFQAKLRAQEPVMLKHMQDQVDKHRNQRK